MTWEELWAEREAAVAELVAAVEATASDLEGVTTLPPANAGGADAGQFAALWNSLTPERREFLFRRLRDDRKTASDCWMFMHDDTIDMLNGRLAEATAHD